jgi:outer membrane receptor for ferrienterochelin and colicins
VFRHSFATVVGALCLPALAQVSPISIPDSAPIPAESLPSKEPTALDKVEIVSPSGENEQRRASTATKIIIKKDEIERFGDSSISEVLKRLPGVTSGGRPGRGGDIRMRGMGGGYTQLLVNGERMSPGFSLDNLSPDQVDRIEILRAPTAEYGAQAVAGTINIVLKETPKQTLDEVKLGVGWEGDRASPNASWTHNDKYGDKINYTLTLSLNHGENRDESDTRTRWYDIPTGHIVLDKDEVGYTKVKFDRVNVNGRLQMSLDEGESLLLTPFIVVSKSAITSESQLDQTPGGAIPPPYDKYADAGDGAHQYPMAKNTG